MTQPFETHLTSYLQHATSNDKATRDQAEQGIRQLEEADWGAYVSCLSAEIANESVPEISRQMAGVLFKNALDAKDTVVKVRGTLRNNHAADHPCLKALIGSP
jgi:hypothetical protein